MQLRIALLRVAVTTAVVVVASKVSLAQAIPAPVLNGAASSANQIAGTNVKIKTSPDSEFDKVLVTTNGATQGRIAATAVDDNGTPNNPNDDVAIGISIDLPKVKEMFPGVMDDPELLQLVLTYILAHEFKHVPCGPAGPLGPGGQGGHGHPGGSSCAHLSDYIADCARLCADVAATLADPNLDAATKCKRVGAMCKLYKHTRGAANNPGNIAAAANCPNLTVTNGQLIGDCPNCPSGDCPVHGTDFGAR